MLLYNIVEMYKNTIDYSVWKMRKRECIDRRHRWRDVTTNRFNQHSINKNSSEKKRNECNDGTEGKGIIPI